MITGMGCVSPNGIGREAFWEATRQGKSGVRRIQRFDPEHLVVQIAGLLARRIVSYVKPGQHLEKGERLGMICFGSRVDLYLPPEAELLVKVGDRVKVKMQDVSDWMIIENRKIYGGFTTRVLISKMSRLQQKKFANFTGAFVEMD